MLKGKELLSQIINDALRAEQSGSDIQQLAFDNTELNAFLSNYNNPLEDILLLTDGMLKNITEYIEPIEEQKKFSAAIKYIRGIAKLNKDKETKIPLSELQLLKLKELKELIKMVIDKNEYLTTHIKDRSEKQIDEYRKILTILQTEKIFTAEDYDIVEKIVRAETPKEAENNLDKIYTFLNEFNSRKMQEMMDNEKSKEILSNKYNVNITNNNDIFDSVVMNNNKKTNTNLEEAERTQKIKEIISYLGYNYDELDINIKLKFIAKKDLIELEELAKHLKEEATLMFNSFKENNIYGLMYVLINSNINIIKEALEIINTFKIEIPSPEFNKILNTGTIIFSKNGFINFKENVQIFKKYNTSFKRIVRDNIMLLSTNPKKIEKLIHKLEKKGADIELIIERLPILFNPKNKDKYNIIEINLNILEMYGFDIDAFFSEESSAFSILFNNNLDEKIDQFIEVGLNEHIHKDYLSAGSQLKALIIKRIYYSFKNKYEVWSNLNKDNELYNKEISENVLIMSDTEIEKIKSMYPVTEILDEGYRAAIYTDAPIGLLKRRTEFVFDTQIISRPKVFKIFKILTDLNIKPKEALLQAIIYNSVLEPHELDYIKSAVNKIGGDDNHDRLLKGA